MNIKKWIVRFLISSTLLCAILNATVIAKDLSPKISDAALEQAKSLLKSTPLIDAHNDLPWLIRDLTGGDVTAYGMTKKNEFDTDIPRLKEGLVGGQFWSVWIPGETPADQARAVQQQQITTAKDIITASPDVFDLALTADDIERIFHKGKIASLLGMEGGYGLNNSLENMREFYRSGVRYMSLTHNISVDWADAALGEHRNGGLSAFGRIMVQEMNRTGMIVDLAHASADTMQDALDISLAPVIWSHAASRELVNHPRNVPNDVLTRVKKNGGVIMVTFIPSFLSKKVWEMEEKLWATDAPNDSITGLRKIWLDYDAKHGAVRATLDDVANHIEYIRTIAGIDHVGIGSDFWGMPDMPVGIEDVSKFPNLFAILIQRGWSDEDLRKLAGGNILRAMRTVERVAAKLQIETEASTATIRDVNMVTEE